MTLLETLETLIGKEIAVVMSDGSTYRGLLKEYDIDILILESIFETSNSQIEFSGSGSYTGNLHWSEIDISELIIRLSMIMRIWPWEVKGKSSEITNQEKTEAVKSYDPAPSSISSSSNDSSEDSFSSYPSAVAETEKNDADVSFEKSEESAELSEEFEFDE